MRQTFIEFIVGIFVIVAFICLAFMAFKVSGLALKSGSGFYKVEASFTNVGSLKVRAPVSMSGVKIGSVTHIDLNPKTFQAMVTMEIDNKFNEIPQDSSANIYTEGLLGSNYIAILPGGSLKNLKNGSVIYNTSPALVLENLIGQLIFSLKGGSKNDSSTSTSQTNQSLSISKH
ncbi:MAG: outer membrane lipid asymmetry maintenance protein MlaD [Pseudomonadota bacterium]